MLIRRTQPERWLPVKGYESYYEVSSLGRIKSLRGTRGNPRKAHQILAGSNGGKGYRTVALCGVPGKRKHAYIHRLVLQAFVGVCPAGMEVAHDDNDKCNNRLRNLAYKTPTGNQADRVRHGTDDRGERSTNAKLSDDIVRKARKLYSEGRSIRKLAEMYGVSSSTMQDACSGTTWRHL